MSFEFTPAKWLIDSIFSYQKASVKCGILSSILKKYATVRYRFWSVISGADIDRNAEICPDLKLPHPIGVVIHQDAIIGPECMIMQLVTIGQLADGAAPKIGRGVYIGAGAKILGGVSIGDNARIGANAVVLTNVPKNTTAVGVPAKIMIREQHCL